MKCRQKQLWPRKFTASWMSSVLERGLWQATVNNASNMDVAVKKKLKTVKIGCFAYMLNLDVQKIHKCNTVAN